MTADPTRRDEGGEPHAPYRYCGARTRTGAPCRGPAMRGQDRCRMHGGAAPQSRALAERRVAEAEARALVSRLLHDQGAAPVDDPLTELQAVAGRMGHAVDVLGERVNALAEVDYADANLVRRAHVAVDAWRELMVEYRRTLTDMVRLDIDGRAVKLAEDQARAVATALEAALGVLALEAAQREQAHGAFMATLRGQVVEVPALEPARATLAALPDPAG